MFDDSRSKVLDLILLHGKRMSYLLVDFYHRGHLNLGELDLHQQ